MKIRISHFSSRSQDAQNRSAGRLLNWCMLAAAGATLVLRPVQAKAQQFQALSSWWSSGTPYQIAVGGPDGAVYIGRLSPGGYAVTEYDRFGQTLLNIGTNPNGVYGLAVDPVDGSIYINHIGYGVGKYDSNGVFVRNFGAGNFGAYRGIGLDNTRNVWVSDYIDNWVEGYTPDGVQFRILASAGSGPHNVGQNPVNNYMYILNYYSGNVAVLDPSGVHLFDLPKNWGDASPLGMNFGPDGRTYINSSGVFRSLQ
jgi:DNA-binding beta-propeller fold protein YncE